MLSSPQIQRKAGYEKTTKEVTRWENVVKQRRGAEHLSFPLEKPDLGIETATERTTAFVVSGRVLPGRWAEYYL